MIDRINEIQRVIAAFPLPHSPLVEHLRRLVDELEREVIRRADYCTGASGIICRGEVSDEEI